MTETTLRNSDLLKILNSPQHQLSPVALTLKNHFQFLARPEEPIDAVAFQNFLDHALAFPHWQQNRRELEEDCRALFEGLVRSGLLAASFLEQIYWPLSQQVIEIENPKSAMDVIHGHWLLRKKAEGGQFKMFDLGEHRYALVALHRDQRISVHQYDNKFVIREGHLEPLRRDLSLHYTSELELDPARPHKVEVAPYILGRFVLEGREAFGNVVRGYIFQQVQALQGQPVEAQPRMFFAIKRLEKLFLKRESDPYYNSLVEDLERILHWMRLGEQVNAIQVHEAYLRAQTALEEVFPGDKMLTLLLRDLEHQSAVLSARTGVPDANRRSSAPARLIENRMLENRAAELRSKESGLESWNPQARAKEMKFGSTKSLPKVVWSPDGPPTDSLKREASPSTERKSSNWESEWTLTKTKSSWEENL